MLSVKQGETQGYMSKLGLLTTTSVRRHVTAYLILTARVLAVLSAALRALALGTDTMSPRALAALATLEQLRSSHATQRADARPCPTAGS